jgi:homoserine dehydrogenase
VSLRLAVVGLGTVGSWLLGAVERGEAGDVEVVLRTSGRDGREGALADAEFDVLAECVNSPPDGEPGATFIREALSRGRHVVTSDKWPVALHGVELAAEARERGVAFRAESTVMSGTPVLAPLIESLEGGPASSLRGVVNATVNRILTEMAGGSSYEDALARAQADGLAEPDPSADTDGRDECAKAMVLAALLFGDQLVPADVRVRGVSSLTAEETAALRAGAPVRSITTIRRTPAGGLEASVEPQTLSPDDPFATIEGVLNAVQLDARPESWLRIGPGAGPEIAGLGVLDDLRAVARLD